MESGLTWTLPISRLLLGENSCEAGKAETYPGFLALKPRAGMTATAKKGGAASKTPLPLGSTSNNQAQILLEVWDHVLAEQPDRLHHLRMRDLVGLQMAEQDLGARLLIGARLPETHFGIAREHHVPVAHPVVGRFGEVNVEHLLHVLVRRHRFAAAHLLRPLQDRA